jgi:hypothetical protein
MAREGSIRKDRDGMASLTIIDILQGVLEGGPKLANWEGDHLSNDDLTGITATLSGTAPVKLKFTFTEAGAAKTIEGERPLVGAGAHVVKVDTVVIPNAEITFELGFQGAKPRAIVRFIVKKAPRERYRFDADVTGL